MQNLVDKEILRTEGLDFAIQVKAKAGKEFVPQESTQTVTISEVQAAVSQDFVFCGK